MRAIELLCTVFFSFYKLTAWLLCILHTRSHPHSIERSKNEFSPFSFSVQVGRCICIYAYVICICVWWKTSANLSWCLPCSEYIEKCKQKWKERKKIICVAFVETKCKCEYYFVLVWISSAAILFIRCSDRHFSTHNISRMCARACSMRQCRFVISSHFSFHRSDTGSESKPRVIKSKSIFCTMQIYVSDLIFVLIHASPIKLLICWVLLDTIAIDVHSIHQSGNQRSQSFSIFASMKRYAQWTPHTHVHVFGGNENLLTFSFSLSRANSLLPTFSWLLWPANTLMISYLQQRRNAHSVWTRNIHILHVGFSIDSIDGNPCSSCDRIRAEKLMKRRTWTICCCVVFSSHKW